MNNDYPPTNKNTLLHALTEKWDKLPQQLLDNVVQSMSNATEKSNLNNASTREARRKRIKRAHQLAEQIESRNLAQRISTAEGHAQESQEQCNERLQENITRTRAAGERDIATGRDAKRVERAQQLPEQIETRNAAQRIRTAESHARESQEQRDERLQQNITRTRVARERNIATVRALDRQRQRISRSLTRASFVRLALNMHQILTTQRIQKLLSVEWIKRSHSTNSIDQRVSPRLQNDNYQIVIKVDKVPLGEHAGRFNAPTVDEVAVIMVGDPVDKRSIKITRRDNTISTISDLHRSYDALQYPLIFWQGQDEYHLNIKQYDPNTEIIKVSSMNYYAHRIMVRQHQDNYILRYRQLFHQYIVDMFAKGRKRTLAIPSVDLIRQKRSEEYIHLRDAVAGNIDGNLNPNDIGNAFILPSSYIGSPRNMQEYMQDAMTYVRHYGPTGFIYYIHIRNSRPVIDQELFDIVTKHMIHGPCGAFNMTSPCMENGKCKKKTSQSRIRMTRSRILMVIQSIAAEVLRMVATHLQCDCRTFQIKLSLIMSGWYHTHHYFQKTYKAHINVELCSSVKSIKYICNYVNKGSDLAIFEVQNINKNDEIARYQMGRYISSNEAIWHILSFPIHERDPAVEHLAIHLENGQRVYFTEENVLQRAFEAPKTTLTEFFTLCQKPDVFGQFAKTLVYGDVPRYFTWNKSSKNGSHGNKENHILPLQAYSKLRHWGDFTRYIKAT
ncbi:helitron_like_N domain-containing protein [Trichonephila clavipes]|nr:helitron_like_N domain-containing protein [Trichonephila clavipes]